LVRLPFSWAGSGNDPDKKKPDPSVDSEQKIPPGNLKDHYHTLAVPLNATTEEIEKAYARMIEKYGPHVSAAECEPEMQIRMLHEIKEAYRVLINPSRRKVHDATLARHYGKGEVHDLSGKIARDKESRDKI
jgi:DnaJ-class molecular chaperone